MIKNNKIFFMKTILQNFYNVFFKIFQTLVGTSQRKIFLYLVFKVTGHTQITD
jgi:hypothetical protein